MIRGTAVLLVLVGAIAVPASAQTMRRYTASRPIAATTIPLRATLEFGAGRVLVHAGDSTQLYGAQIEYDTERYTPINRYDSRTGILRLGLDAVGNAGLRVTSWKHLDQVATFTFSPTVPLYLEANLGASEAAIDLAGLTLRTLAIRAGATRGTVDVSTPTQGECETATFSAGAGELRVLNFANAGCAVIKLDGGAGMLTLDLDGEWREDTRLAVSLNVGTLLLRVPRDVGLRITATDQFLSRVKADGLEQRGDRRESANFASAVHHLTVDLTASLAEVRVEWLEK